MKYLAGTAGGFVVALAAGIVADVFFASSANSSEFWFVGTFVVCWTLTFWCCRLASSAYAAWSQVTGGLGFILFLAPFALFQQFDAQPVENQVHQISANPLDLVFLVGGAVFLCWPVAFICAIINYLLDKKSKAFIVASDNSSLSTTSNESMPTASKESMPEPH